ncbi:hypothetical protein XENTR_v10019873 [Xenopus tropicalis]|nr:hypothetical protein XENTR_v10019873 [Xenopus tropicalis]
MEPGDTQVSAVPQHAVAPDKDLLELLTFLNAYESGGPGGHVGGNEDSWAENRGMDSGDDVPDDYYYYNEQGSSDEDEDDDDGAWDGTYCGFRPSFLYPYYSNLPTPTVITQEEADRNAQELVEQEKREKEKANKKRLKKKRQKERKRQQKLGESLNNITVSHENEDDLDFGSSFVCQAKKKMERKPKPERKDRAGEGSRDRAGEGSRDRAGEGSRDRAGEGSRDRANGGSRDRANERDVNVSVKSPKPVQEQAHSAHGYRLQQSLHLANIGNNCASGGKFAEAIAHYSDAIRLNPTEYRFLGNRSYSYERCGRYREALQDAERALQLEPHFVRGYFRKGKALKGLKRYAEAIVAFQNVLLNDLNHPEAASEIESCQLMAPDVSSVTRVKIIPNSPLSPPLTPPGSAPGPEQCCVPRTLVYTRADINNTPPKAKIPYNTARPSAPQNPPSPSTSKLYPVWVGNITNQITEGVLRSHFEPFGSVHSMRILYSRTCAFINFTNREAAETAFHALQGLTVEGTTFVLQLRNPEHRKLISGK